MYYYTWTPWTNSHIHISKHVLRLFSHNWRAFTVMTCNQISRHIAYRVNLTLWSFQIMFLKVKHVISVPLDKEITSQLLIKYVFEVYRFTTYWIYHIVMWPRMAYDKCSLPCMMTSLLMASWCPLGVTFRISAEVDHLCSFWLLLYKYCIFRQTIHLTYAY